MKIRATMQALCALGVCAAIAVCTQFVTRSTAQSAKEGQPQVGDNASPIYGVTIPAGYRDWSVISVSHLGAGNLKQLRAQLSNDIATKAFREGKLPFPDGTIIAALHWNEAADGNSSKPHTSAGPVKGTSPKVVVFVENQRCGT
jgi:hypothetical protein